MTNLTQESRLISEALQRRTESMLDEYYSSPYDDRKQEIISDLKNLGQKQLAYELQFDLDSESEPEDSYALEL